jgi:hypothetical protein
MCGRRTDQIRVYSTVPLPFGWHELFYSYGAYIGPKGCILRQQRILYNVEDNQSEIKLSLHYQVPVVKVKSVLTRCPCDGDIHGCLGVLMMSICCGAHKTHRAKRWSRKADYED